MEAILWVSLMLLPREATLSKLAVDRVQFAYSPVGQERPPVFSPGEEMVLRYVASGLKTNSDGAVRTQLLVRIERADGTKLLELRGIPEEKWLGLGKRACLDSLKLRAGPTL